MVIESRRVVTDTGSEAVCVRRFDVTREVAVSVKA
jgi:hypothetical protein